MRWQLTRQAATQERAGNRWQKNGLVFASEVGTELDRHNVLRGFRRILKAAGLTPEDWTLRELRHSFVSLLSDAKVSIEVISRLVGHSGTAVTERVCRHQIRPVVRISASSLRVARQHVDDLSRTPNEVPQGPWNPQGGGGSDYYFLRKGEDVVVTKSDGSFVTILKGGQSNGWFNSATPVT